MHLSPLLTDDATLGEIGNRFMQRRLQRNLTQAELSARAGVSKRTIERLEEGGSSQFANVVKVIRALDLFDGLDRLVPEVGPSPIQQAKLQGRQRKRASGTAAKAVAKGGAAAVGAGKPRVASRTKTAAKGSGKAWSWGDAR